jgi:antitoxin CptB
MAMTDVPPHLRWACRRGMLELDVLLGNFLTEAYAKISQPEQVLFEQFLTNNDQDLFMWLTGKEICTQPDFAKMIEKIRHHAETRHKA